jgi:hypothetical protein
VHDFGRFERVANDLERLLAGHDRRGERSPAWGRTGTGLRTASEARPKEMTLTIRISSIRPMEATTKTFAKFSSGDPSRLGKWLGCKSHMTKPISTSMQTAVMRNVRSGCLRSSPSRLR